MVNGIRYSIAWFEDMLTDPEPVIQHIGDFLHMDSPNISEALKNVETR